MSQRRRFVWPGLGVVVPGLFGLLVLVIAVVMWGVDRHMDEHGVQTTAVVEMVDPDGWDAVSYFVGDTRYEIAEADALGHAVGATLVVVYDPDDPSYAVVQGDSVNENVHWWALFVAALLLIVAALNSGLTAVVGDRFPGRFDKDQGARGGRGRWKARAAFGVRCDGAGRRTGPWRGCPSPRGGVERVTPAAAAQSVRVIATPGRTSPEVERSRKLRSMMTSRTTDDGKARRKWTGYRRSRSVRIGKAHATKTKTGSSIIPKSFQPDLNLEDLRTAILAARCGTRRSFR